MSAPSRIVIVGAGPTGLGAAHRLQELGHHDFVVLEAGPCVGGLARSVVDERGFTWDIGGHVQFSHYSYYDDVVERALDGRWLEHDRESWIWIAGSWVPYPLQYNLHRLPAELRERALRGLEEVAGERRATPADFREWIRANFGTGLAELFLEPYNRKVWGYPPEEMDVGWMGERVAVPDLERVRRGIRENRDDVSWGPNNRFRFPESGGTGAIWEGVARQLQPGRILLSSPVVAVDAGAKTLRSEAGELFEWDALISTMPLDRLCRCLEGSARPWPGAGRLRHSAVHVVGIGLCGPRPESLRRKCWMYFPEPSSPYYRVTVFSNYSPRNVPARPAHWSLMAEVCESPSKAVDRAGLVEATIDALRRDGLVPEETEVVSRWHHREEHGYPTPFLGRDEVLAVLRRALESHAIFSRGRFGSWRYEVSNQDHSFMQGVEVVNRLLLGEPEPTLNGETER